jgi:hypothetical protein
VRAFREGRKPVEACVGVRGVYVERRLVWCGAEVYSCNRGAKRLLNTRIGESYSFPTNHGSSFPRSTMCTVCLTYRNNVQMKPEDLTGANGAIRICCDQLFSSARYSIILYRSQDTTVRHGSLNKISGASPQSLGAGKTDTRGHVHSTVYRIRNGRGQRRPHHMPYSLEEPFLGRGAR